MHISDVLQAFHGMSVCDRLDLVCHVLRHCLPNELHFVGTLVCDLARSEYKALLKAETAANRVNYYFGFKDHGLTHDICEKLCCALSVVRADNHPVAEVIFNLLNDRRVLNFFEEMSDVTVLEDFRLLYVMAVNHPAFSFSQKLHLAYSFLQRMDAIFAEKSKTQMSASFSSGSVEKSGDGDVARFQPGGCFKEPAANAFITRCDVHSVYKRPSDRRYVYMIQAEWSDGTSYTVRRTYGDFFSFQNKLLDLFPEEAGQKHKKQRVIPYLPGKRLLNKSNRELAERRLPELAKYASDLSALPTRITRSVHLLDFFKPRLSDRSEEYPPLHRITTLHDLIESGKIRHPSAPAVLKNSPVHSPMVSHKSPFQRLMGRGSGNDSGSDSGSPPTTQRSSHTLPHSIQSSVQQPKPEDSPLERRSTYPSRAGKSAFTPVVPPQGQISTTASSMTSVATQQSVASSVTPPSVSSMSTSPSLLPPVSFALPASSSASNSHIAVSSIGTSTDSIVATSSGTDLASTTLSTKQVGSLSTGLVDHRGGPTTYPRPQGYQYDASKGQERAHVSATSGGFSIRQPVVTTAPSGIASSTSLVQSVFPHPQARRVPVTVLSTASESVSSTSTPSNKNNSFVTSPTACIITPLLPSHITAMRPLPSHPHSHPHTYPPSHMPYTHHPHPHAATHTSMATPSPPQSGSSTPILPFSPSILIGQTAISPVPQLPGVFLGSPLQSPLLSPRAPRVARSYNCVAHCDSLGKWLKHLRLHKYTYLFENMTFEEMCNLTEEQLMEKSMTKGAAHKLHTKLEELKRSNFPGFRDMPFSAGMSRKPSTCSLPAALLLERGITPSSSIDGLSPTESTCSLDKFVEESTSGPPLTISPSSHRRSTSYVTATDHPPRALGDQGSVALATGVRTSASELSPVIASVDTAILKVVPSKVNGEVGSGGVSTPSSGLPGGRVPVTREPLAMLSQQQQHPSPVTAGLPSTASTPKRDGQERSEPSVSGGETSWADQVVPNEDVGVNRPQWAVSHNNDFGSMGAGRVGGAGRGGIPSSYHQFHPHVHHHPNSHAHHSPHIQSTPFRQLLTTSHPSPSPSSSSCSSQGTPQLTRHSVSKRQSGDTYNASVVQIIGAADRRPLGKENGYPEGSPPLYHASQVLPHGVTGELMSPRGVAVHGTATAPVPLVNQHQLPQMLPNSLVRGTAGRSQQIHSTNLQAAYASAYTNGLIRTPPQPTAVPRLPHPSPAAPGMMAYPMPPPGVGSGGGRVGVARPPPTQTITCFNCGRRGHSGMSCPAETMESNVPEAFHRQLDKLAKSKSSRDHRTVQ